MDLETLRGGIDNIDDQIKSLFEQRMNLCKQVADYKKEHALPIMQGGREKQVLDRAQAGLPEEYAGGTRVLFTNIMDISKCLQNSSMTSYNEFTQKIIERMQNPVSRSERPRVACPGVAGSYSHIAAEKVFPDGEIRFTGGFEEVVQALENGEVDFGILPIENSTAGSVRDVYELVKEYDFYINYETKIKVEHCIAAKPSVKLSDIQHVYSHEQALAQCGWYLKKLGVPCDAFKNTAMAAEYVANSSEPYAALCSELAAKLYGLEILERGVQNSEENYTRFICFSKELYFSERAQAISVSLAIPNTSGSLYRLLTKFAVNDFNMTKIESKPLGNKNFDAMFYIDFNASLADKRALDLINDLSGGIAVFKFLGNYERLD